MASVMAGATMDQARPSAEFLYFTLISVAINFPRSSRLRQISARRELIATSAETTRVTLGRCSRNGASASAEASLAT